MMIIKNSLHSWSEILACISFATQPLQNLIYSCSSPTVNNVLQFAFIALQYSQSAFEVYFEALFIVL